MNGAGEWVGSGEQPIFGGGDGAAAAGGVCGKGVAGVCLDRSQRRGGEGWTEDEADEGFDFWQSEGWAAVDGGGSEPGHRFADEGAGGRGCGGQGLGDLQRAGVSE